MVDVITRWHVRHFDEVLQVSLGSDDVLEDLLRDAGDDALQIRVIYIRTVIIEQG